MAGEKKTPILIGASGAKVVRVQLSTGASLIEKSGPGPGIAAEAAALNWCACRLPVPQLLGQSEGVLIMSDLAGVNLTEVSLETAVNVVVDALERIHTLPVEGFPLPAQWTFRLSEAQRRMEAGLVDETDFDTENLGRKPADMLAELKSLPLLPDLVRFTHGDACLENFLSFQEQLSGIVDWGRAGVTHPAQDWALALRSMHSHFGLDGKRALRDRVPLHSQSEDLLGRFRLLDEFF